MSRLTFDQVKVLAVAVKRECGTEAARSAIQVYAASLSQVQARDYDSLGRVLQRKLAEREEALDREMRVVEKAFLADDKKVHLVVTLLVEIAEHLTANKMDKDGYPRPDYPYEIENTLTELKAHVSEMEK